MIITGTDISLDLETWGTTPGSDIRSIGAIVFNRMSGRVGGAPEHMPQGNPGDVRDMRTPAVFYAACENPSKVMQPDETTLGNWFLLHRDPQTVQWWSEQSEEAQAAFSEAMPLDYALRSFADWLASFEAPVRLWSHGAAFDPPILAAAYAACDIALPWHYRAPRDTRTVFDDAGIADHNALLEALKVGTHHHALCDAMTQAKAICHATALIHAIGTRQGSAIADLVEWAREQAAPLDTGVLPSDHIDHGHRYTLRDILQRMGT